MSRELEDRIKRLEEKNRKAWEINQELKHSLDPAEYYSVLGSEFKKYLEWKENK